MRNGVRITGIMILLIVASISLNAQRGMRGMRQDSVRMHMMMQPGQMQMMRHPDSTMMRGMRHGMGQMPMNRMGQAGCPMCPVWQQRPAFRHRGMGMMGPGFRRGWYGMGMQERPFINSTRPGRIIDNIPNLTEKQKKDISDLRQKQQEEMKKFRTEMQAKMKTMRDAQREKVRSLLNDEQKKWFDENAPRPPVR